MPLMQCDAVRCRSSSPGVNAHISASSRLPERVVCETVMSVPALLASSACLPPHLSCHQPGFLCSASYKGLSSTSVLVTGIILRESLQINQSRANSHPGVHATRPGGAMNACLHTPGVHARPPTVFARLGFWRGGAARPGIYTPGVQMQVWVTPRRHVPDVGTVVRMSG